MGNNQNFKIKSGVAGTHFGYTGDKIRELHKAGKTYNEIQEIVGCSKGTIAYHLGIGCKEKSLARQRKYKGKQ